MAYEDAYAILAERETLRAGSFLCQYLYAFDAAMTGRLDVVREAVAASSSPTRPSISRCEGTIDRDHRARRSSCRCVHARRRRSTRLALRADRRPVAASIAVRHTRRRCTVDSRGCRTRTRGSRPGSIACARSSPACHACMRSKVARTRSSHTRRRCDSVYRYAPWPTIGVPAPGLIVAYSLDELPRSTLNVLSQRRPDQILFAHASPWTHDFPIAPDVTTLLCQSVAAPWGEVMKIDPDSREVDEVRARSANGGGDRSRDRREPRSRPDELIADDGLAWDALVACVWPLDQGVRTRLWAGGPVPSNRFD